MLKYLVSEQPLCVKALGLLVFKTQKMSPSLNTGWDCTINH